MLTVQEVPQELEPLAAVPRVAVQQVLAAVPPKAQQVLPEAARVVVVVSIRPTRTGGVHEMPRTSTLDFCFFFDFVCTG